jgi:iron-sulfur cluster repair protein YtfE (RIC family)
MTQAMAPEEPVSVALELHNRRLDDMLDRAEIDVEVGDWSEARRRFSLFREQPGRSGAGSTSVMRAEHAQIRQLLEVIEEFVHVAQPVSDVTDMLEALLGAHNAREERVLYPMFERLAPPEAYAALTGELRPLLRAPR